MHNYLSDFFYNLFSNICKIFGTSEKFLSFLGFSVFLIETCVSIGIYLCVHDFRAGDWSPSKWQHFSLSATAKGRICVPILSSKAIKRTGCTVTGSISLWRLQGGDSGKSYCFSQVWRDPAKSEYRQRKIKTVREMEAVISMWIL